MCYDGSCIRGKLEKKRTSGQEVSAVVLTGMYRGTLEFCNVYEQVLYKVMLVEYSLPRTYVR